MITIMTDVDNKLFWLQFPYSHKIIQVVKTIDGRKWQPDFKMWYLPATPAQASMIDRTLRAYQYTADAVFNEMLVQHDQGRDVLKAEPVFRETCTQCFHHQLIGLDMGVTREAIYLAWQMGTGKSKTGVDIAGTLGLKRTLILCPKSVVGEWPKQFITHGHTYGIRCVPLNRKTVSVRTKIAAKALEVGPAAVVINYEAAWRTPFAEWALAQQWDLVILDECTKIKEGKSKVSKFAHKLAARASRRVCMSGTPIPNNPLDLWSQCKFLDAGLFGDSFVAFRNRYAVLGGFQDKQVVAFRNLDDMNRRFYEIAHRVTKEEALDLPEEMDETREAELSPAGAKHYDKMQGAFVAQVEEGSITMANVLVESLRLQQCTGGAVQYDGVEGVTEIDDAKAGMLREIMEGLATAEPIVVFCQFRHDLEVVHRVAAQDNRVSYELSGSKNELEKWRTGDPQATVLAVQIQAGGLGVDLTRSCYCIYYSLGYSLGSYFQSRARLHRYGQNRPVTYYHLLATCKDKKTIDHKIYRALAKKENVAKAVLTMGK